MSAQHTPLPTVDDIVSALLQHPGLFQQLAKQVVHRLLDTWTPHRFQNQHRSARFLACTATEVAWVGERRDGKWFGGCVGVGRITGQPFDTEVAAKTAADDWLRAHGYILLDIPFDRWLGQVREHENS